MAAPAETVVHGTSQTLIGCSDEPASSPTVKVQSIEKAFTSTLVESKNTNNTTVYAVETDRRMEMSLKGQVALDSGLGNAAPGSALASSANFATTDRTFDPAVGVMITRDITDSMENLKREPNTAFKVLHLPHVA